MDKVLNRDRLVVLAALAAVVALAWAYLAYIVLAQPAMDMDAIAMAAMPPPVWDIRYFAATLAMWMVMMIGMMLPSAARRHFSPPATCSPGPRSASSQRRRNGL